MAQFYDRVAAKLAAGQALELVLVLQSYGSAPRGAGAVMAVQTSGETFGTVGGGLVEFRAQKLAAELLRSQASRLEQVFLGPTEQQGIGMSCGGDVVLYYAYIPAETIWADFFLRLNQASQSQRRAWLVVSEGLGSPQALQLTEDPDYLRSLSLTKATPNVSLPQLGRRPVFWQDKQETFYYALPLFEKGLVYIFGAGHVAQALVPVLESCFFPCVVLDNRAEFATRERFPQAYRVLNQDMPGFFDDQVITADDYIIIVTRGHRDDEKVLNRALDTPAGYIGMIGSANKVSAVFTDLIRSHERSYADVRRVHSPIGLPLGGNTPEEIAVSITAELLRERDQRS
ncbi:MAG: XdhC family protein [Oscillospiraceae bacterium]|nr:XdhC family protein [Oscillospiraceae bacterium]MDD4367709.1 XdhC family protein [Oscillospiraceae bacterium]